MDAQASAASPGTQIVQRTWTGPANQQWRLLPIAGDVHVIASVGTGMVLDVAGSTVDGGRVVQSPWTGAVSQWWRAVPFSTILPGGDPNAYALVSMHSGKVVDVAQRSKAEGAPLLQWAWHGGLNQIWIRLPV